MSAIYFIFAFFISIISRDLDLLVRFYYFVEFRAKSGGYKEPYLRVLPKQ